MKKRNVLTLVLVVFFCGLGIRVWSSVRWNHVEKQYCMAAAMIAEGDYREGRETLRSICGMDYADADALLKLCDACEYLEENQYTWAWYEVRNFEFEELPSEQESEIRLILSRIEDGYLREQGQTAVEYINENCAG